MKTLLFTLLVCAAAAGCVVIPAEPAVVIGPARAYAYPPPVVVVPGRPYYGSGYWYPHRRGYE